MRILITVLMLVTYALWSSCAAVAEVNYDLFPGYGEKRGFPPMVSYRAWVISYKDNKYYVCVASYDLATPKTPMLQCTLGGSYNPSLLNGPDVKTIQALGGPRGATGTEEARSAFFWQIDQASGKIQFCIPISGTNCVAYQVP